MAKFYGRIDVPSYLRIGIAGNTLLMFLLRQSVDISSTVRPRSCASS